MGECSRLVRALAVFVATSALPIASAQAAEGKPAQAVLDSLPVAAEVDAGYDRDMFRHWTTQRGGCDTRAEVLIAERTAGNVVGCRVQNGRWVSFYDARLVTNPRSLDIDHMVPLKEAWDSGAWRWDAATRERYANDLGYASSLVAVTAASNRSKSDRDPSEWLPAQGRCRYAKAWVGVKYRWRLSVDPAEKRVLSRVLASCPRLMTVPKVAPRSSVPAAPQPSSPPSASTDGTDPRFDTCGAANAAGYGPYTRGRDVEYDWYIDRDKDGVVCEP